MGRRIHTSRFLFVCGYFLNQLSGIYCDVLEGPFNTASVLGSRTILTCKIEDEQQQWQDDYSGSIQPTISVDDHVSTSYQGIYFVNGTAKNFNLVLLSTTYDQVGTHTCLDLFASDLASAEIIVLESNTICTTNTTDVGDLLIEGEYVYYMCSVRYKGLWGPKMTWSTNTDVGINPDDESDNTQEIKLLQHAYTSQVSSYNDGQSLRIVTSFDRPTSPPANRATNAPDYTYTWNSPALIVHHPPRDILFQHCTDTGCSRVSDSDTDISINPGDRLHASAEANPHVDYYTWTNDSDVIIEGPDKSEITFLDLGYSTVQCIVSNTMRGSRQSAINRTMHVMVVPSTPAPVTTAHTSSESEMTSSTDPLTTTSTPDQTGVPGGLSEGEITGIAIGCLVIVSLILFMVFVIYKRQQKHPDGRSRLTDPMPMASQSVTNADHMHSQVKGEYEHLHHSPYINTRQDRPENNVYADITREETPYAQI